MTERRETGRGRSKRQTSPSRNRQGNGPKPPSRPTSWEEGDRIAKYLAHAGVCSRRDAEVLIEEGAVTVNGQRLDSPAFKVSSRDVIKVRGEIVRPPEASRVWLYHKPAGLITATRDPEGRATIFEHLPKSLPRVVTIGRLDLTTEGLLLLTNDGELARQMELPSTGLERHYRARAHGVVTPEALASLAEGVTVDGMTYAPIEAVLERTTGTNNWLSVTLHEGKNREVRKALASVGLTVNRLIRTRYGPFELGDLASGTLTELSSKDIQGLRDAGIETGRMKAPKGQSKDRKALAGDPRKRVHTARKRRNLSRK